MPKVMTMAVRTMAWGSGSLISSGSAYPDDRRARGPPGTSSSRLVALPSRSRRAGCGSGCVEQQEHAGREERRRR